MNVPRKSFLDVPDDALLQVLLCMSYPRCAVLAATNKRLSALFKSKPLAARRAARRAWHLTVTAMRENAKFNAKPARERGWDILDGYGVAKEELVLIAKEFPDALHERHLPPYAIRRTGAMSPNAWRYSRVFDKRPNEVYDAFFNYNRSLFAAAAAWHGSLPDEPLTPLELAVSYPKRDGVGGVVFALLDLGAKPTKLGLDIAHANCDMELGCWTMQLLIHEPRLVSTTEYDLDYCAERIDLELEDEDIEYSCCPHLVEDRGVVPTVGVNMAADGAFAEKYPQDVVDEWLEDASFKKYCRGCDDEAKPRDAFSDGEWERKLGPRYCRECLVSADLRRRLVAFQRHNPAMRRYQIDAIIREWGHNETELWRQMAIKYGQRAVDAAPPAHKIV